MIMKKRLHGDDYLHISRNQFLILLICILSGLLLFCAGCQSDIYPDYFRSDISYGLTIYTNSPITNVTFYLPLPVHDGQPMVGRRVLHESDFVGNNFTASFTQSPPGINLTGSYPVPGNNSPWYVKLSAHQILPGPETGPAPGSALHIQVSDNRGLSNPLLFTDTLNPVGNESVFLPKIDFTPSVPTRKQSRTREWLEYDQLMIPGKILIYAEYSASPSTVVHGGSSIWAYNSWKEPDDISVGNSYSDHYSWSHTGESYGWQIASGALYVGGQGIYPNLTDPSW